MPCRPRSRARKLGASPQPLPAGGGSATAAAGGPPCPPPHTPAPERRAAAAGRCTPRRSRGTLKDGRWVLTVVRDDQSVAHERVLLSPFLSRNHAASVKPAMVLVSLAADLLSAPTSAGSAVSPEPSGLGLKQVPQWSATWRSARWCRRSNHANPSSRCRSRWCCMSGG
jgi:hypothetical protein